ncbi:MAG TPA: 16S rRNA (guanine(527)-N(7))-methyltransferase RsmG [Thermoclostridium caenicola]|uniref:16S rRNA (guanine(527)-N(7))-methyltransferase RsmG n=1 Tax=Thermoclostridium caenicola TaxID=659425 RepID=UPI002CC25147|nr:16S rRNA (guanine(527)-N(7))-methyltransferase RsmG [Thermoclostridium caenicola]HOK42543.1 16S rRNA (guanine(527)-N(7))-methyltransferase RsmG [Thermoclostridium caenicola]HOL84271.1 16S rRNA (guanine(527)-N(7))-methyltransferase RsmG [Thermoclostridium caenicola]HPO76429.1 16S rRNA (guanine(527)-N(7))-methyltransferase RsmG [Thermoclostridium caenicola]HPU22402.1 16S rRNA (guanine(527)-N(7))-methyltransferase RsmG [Thermoclostridium caenicola]
MELLSEGAKALGLDLGKEKQDQFGAYTRLMLEWNDKINLTAITEEKEIIIKHYLDSLSICGLAELNGKTLIDVGTGAGLPGIPLKIVEESLTVTLLDSLEKRVKFLREVIGQLSLKGIEAVHGRAEDYGVKPDFREKFDLAVARAVADLPVLCEYCLPFVKPGGFFIAMKGPSVEQELEESGKALSVLGGEVADVRKLVLPFSEYERSIVLIRKCRHTPSGYPRKSGKPTKSPIR